MFSNGGCRLSLPTPSPCCRSQSQHNPAWVCAFGMPLTPTLPLWRSGAESPHGSGVMGIESQVSAQGESDPRDPALCVTLEAEVPEVLFLGLRRFLDSHPQWDQYSVITSALAVFLFQNGCQDPSVTQHYLDGLFLRP